MSVDPVNVADYERLAEGILAAGPLGYFAGALETSGRCVTTWLRGGVACCARACWWT